MWSVMIPAWNSEQFVAAAIESVLASGLSGESQIEVVDDASTDSTPGLVSSYADRGVAYHRNERQHGAAANFNECVRRARGHLVHILHADDAVYPDFYVAMERALSGSGAIAAFSRTSYIDEAGAVTNTTRSEGPSGIWDGAIRTLAVSNRIRPPGIVVRRSAYEAVGGYREDLHHAADWEMWVRLARHGPIWFEDRVLARYRIHEDQDTSVHVSTAANISERVAAIEMIADTLPAEMARPAVRRGLLYSSIFAGRTALRLGRNREWGAAVAQTRAALRCAFGGVVASTRLAGGGSKHDTRSAP